MRIAPEHYYARRRLRINQEVKAFDSLVSSPFDLGSAAAGNPLPNTFALPHNGRFAISASQITAQGDLLISFGTRTLTTDGADADSIVRLHYADRGKEVQVSSGGACPASNVTLYLLDEFFRPLAIATGSIS